MLEDCSFGPLVATHFQVALPVFDVVEWYPVYSDDVSYSQLRTKAYTPMETTFFSQSETDLHYLRMLTACLAHFPQVIQFHCDPKIKLIC